MQFFLFIGWFILIRFCRTSICARLIDLLLDAFLSICPKSPVGVERKEYTVSESKWIFSIHPKIFVLTVLRLCSHHTVFINLSDKPEWYLNIFPAGKVPALIYENKFLSESLLLAEFLDELYPEPSLWNDSPLQKILDKMFIESFGKVSVVV